MRLSGICSALVFLGFFAPPVPAAEEPDFTEKVIYGGDDRVDYTAAPPEWQKLADSTVALFFGDKVGSDGSLPRTTLGEKRKLCAGQRFADQPSGSYCSGTLVAPDLIMTAGHCIKLPADPSWYEPVPLCDNIKFVFGYNNKNGNPAKAAPQDIYKCAGTVVRVHYGPAARTSDYALIKLDRPVPQSGPFAHVPLQLNRGAAVAAGDSVAAIGYPSGLPLKVAANAKVRDISDPVFFVANMDTFGGNSGGMVFNTRTGLVEGIVVRGDTDYKSGNSQDSCNVYNVNPENGGRGEDVIRVAPLLPYLKAESSASPMAVKKAAPAEMMEQAATVSRALAGR